MKFKNLPSTNVKVKIKNAKYNFTIRKFQPNLSEPNIKLAFSIFWLLASILFEVSEANCVTNPISVSNITNCIDNKCFYTQLASAVLPLSTGSSSCFSFSSLDRGQDIKVEIFVNNSVASSLLSNCYWTDDPVFVSTYNCHCPGSPVTTGTCPCNSGSTPFSPNEFCISGLSRSTGCIFVSDTSWCTNIGYSLLPRYYVCDLAQNFDWWISLSIFDTFDNCSHSYLLNKDINYFNDPTGQYNVTISNIASNLVAPGTHYIKDTQTNNEYVFPTGYVNSLVETDPSKFGSVKLLLNGTIYFPSSVKQAFTINTVSCINDVANFVSPILSFTDLLTNTGKHNRNSELSTPILTSGVMFYDYLDVLNYFGVDVNGNPIYGPNVVQVQNLNISIAPGLCPNLSPISNQPTYYNSSCSSFWPKYFVNSALLYNYQPVFTYCPGEVVYLSFCQFVTSGAYGPLNYCLCSTDNGYTPVFAPVFPNRVNPSTLYLNYQLLTNKTLVSNITYSRSITDDVYTFPSLQISGLITLQYQNYFIKFESDTTRPRLTSACVEDYSLKIRARSLSNPGNCVVGTYPQIMTVNHIFLTNTDSDFLYSLLPISVSGCINITISCGVLSDFFLLQVSINSGFELTNKEVLLKGFSPFNFEDQTPWYFYLFKAFIILLMCAAVIIFGYLAYCFLRKKIWPMMNKKRITMKKMLNRQSKKPAPKFF